MLGYASLDWGRLPGNLLTYQCSPDLVHVPKCYKFNLIHMFLKRKINILPRLPWKNKLRLWECTKVKFRGFAFEFDFFFKTLYIFLGSKTGNLFERRSFLKPLHHNYIFLLRSSACIHFRKICKHKFPVFPPPCFSSTSKNKFKLTKKVYKQRYFQKYARYKIIFCLFFYFSTTLFDDPHKLSDFSNKSSAHDF